MRKPASTAAKVLTANTAAGQGGDGSAIRVRLDELLAQRGMTLTELSGTVGITVVNLSILKNGRAKAIRFSTLALLCGALGCQPGDLLSFYPPEPWAGQRLAGAGELGADRPQPRAEFVVPRGR